MLWLVVPLILAGLISVQLLRRIDNRLVLGSGFAVMAAACLLNAGLTSAWASDNFFVPQIVMGCGFALSFTGLVALLVENVIDVGGLSNPFNVLTYSAFVHTVRLFGGESGSAIMQRLVAVREKFHSNMIGLHVGSGNWLTDERLKMLTGGLLPNSSGSEAAQGRALQLLGGQMKVQAYTLAYADGFVVIAFVAAIAIVLTASMRPIKSYFGTPAVDAPKQNSNTPRPDAAGRRSNMSRQRVIIVGGGFGGVTLAQHLERKLTSEAEIVLISSENHFVFTPMLAEVVGRSISPVHMSVAGRQMVRRTTWLTAHVTDIDLQSQCCSLPSALAAKAHRLRTITWYWPAARYSPRPPTPRLGRSSAVRPPSRERAVGAQASAARWR